MLILRSLLFPIGLIAGVAEAADCSRDGLSGAFLKFWEAGKAGSSPSNLAEKVKIALNNKLATSLSATPFAGIKTSAWTPFNVQTLDTELCEIAAFKVSPQMLLSTRLKVEPESGQIIEVEFLQAVKGDQFFRPSGMPQQEPALFHEKQVPTPPPQIPAVWTPAGGMSNHSAQISSATCKAKTGAPRLWTRREILYAGSSYCDALKGKPYDNCAFAGSSCPRNENGVTTTGNCGVGAGAFGFTVKGRRWVVDTDTGIALGIFYFEYSTTGSNLFLHEYIKVQRGTLSYIFAPMKNIPHAQAAASIFAQELK